jgi:hypothetical protein
VKIASIPLEAQSDSLIPINPFMEYGPMKDYVLWEPGLRAGRGNFLVPENAPPKRRVWLTKPILLLLIAIVSGWFGWVLLGFWGAVLLALVLPIFSGTGSSREDLKNYLAILLTAFI